MSEFIDNTSADERDANEAYVVREITSHLLIAEQPRVPIITTLHSTSEDPEAIRIAFNVGLDEPVEWILARSLLKVSENPEERAQPKGAGDVLVKITDDIAGYNTATVQVKLESPFGQATFEFPEREVNDFITDSYTAIPEAVADKIVSTRFDAEISGVMQNTTIRAWNPAVDKTPAYEVDNYPSYDEMPADILSKRFDAQVEEMLTSDGIRAWNPEADTNIAPHDKIDY